MDQLADAVWAVLITVSGVNNAGVVLPLTSRSTFQPSVIFVLSSTKESGLKTFFFFCMVAGFSLRRVCVCVCVASWVPLCGGFHLSQQARHRGNSRYWNLLERLYIWSGLGTAWKKMESLRVEGQGTLDRNTLFISNWPLMMVYEWFSLKNEINLFVHYIFVTVTYTFLYNIYTKL